jgi:DNA invertase Pin-like site-specific DNA recombinase
MIYGYARVSTVGQTLAVQKDLLHKAGVEKLYAEKVSGKEAAKRPKLEQLLDLLEPGDVLIVTKLDRLARSSWDLHRILRRVKAAEAEFKSLAESWIDTTTPHGRLILTVLGGIAEFERELILLRTNEGRVKAKADGVVFGRKPKLTAHQRHEALKRLGKGETTREIAASYAVDQSTIVRLNARHRALQPLAQ